MGRANFWDHKDKESLAKRKQGLNPIWRGIGCLLLSGLTIGGYFFADWLLLENDRQGWLAIPNSYYSPPFAPWLPDGLLIKIVVAFIFFIFTFGFLNLVYALLLPTEPEKAAPPPLKRTVRKRR